MQSQKKQNKFKTLLFYLLWYSRNYKYFFNFLFILINKIKNIFSGKEKIKVKKKHLKKNISAIKFVKKILKKKDLIDFGSKRIYLNRKRILKSKIKYYGGAADLNLIYNISSITRPKNILESGVALGWSSLAFLQAIKENKIGCLSSIDMPYMDKNKVSYVGLAVPSELKKNWKLYKYPDRVILKSLIKKGIKFDIVHYDSDKSYYGRMWFYKKIWSHIRRGGFFISDDVKDNYAFIDFAKYVNKNYYLIKSKKKFSGIIIK